MNWKHSRFKGGVKWVCWAIGAWVTCRKNEPLHVGLNLQYLGRWEMEPKQAKSELEKRYLAQVRGN